jgi:Zn-dependent protease with chaperone function
VSFGLLPATIAVLVGVGASFIPPRLRPSSAVRMMTVLAAVAALAVLWGLAMVAIGLLSQVPWLAEYAGWCQRALGVHNVVPPAVGVAALGFVPVMLGAVLRFELRWRSTVRRWGRQAAASLVELDGSAVELLPTDEAVAFTVPGDPGHVVMSAGMLRALDEAERRALIAHEKSHLTRRHHRYVHLVGLLSAGMPFLRPLLAQTRFATERWADEDAAVAVGDRVTVARAIARAALTASPASPPSLAIAGCGVPARVAALLEPSPPLPRITMVALAAGGLAMLTSITSSWVQLHHLLAFSAHVCGLG